MNKNEQIHRLYKSVFISILIALFAMYGLTFITGLIFGEGDYALLMSFLFTIIFLLVHLHFYIKDLLEKHLK